MAQPRVIHFISSLKRGGRERQLSTIYSNNSAQRQHIKIVYLNESADSYIEEFKIRKEDIYRIKSRQFLFRLWKLNTYLRSQKPDVVYAWGALEFFLASLVKPFVGFKLINGSIRHGIVSNQLSHRWRTFLLHHSRYVVANSRAGLLANGLKHGFVLYNGIDSKFFQKQKAQPEFADFFSTLQRPVIISVANLVPYKDYPTVFEALKLIKAKGLEFSYLIIGDGPRRAEFEQMVLLLGLNEHVHFMGICINVEHYLHASDIFIHSSKGEGCSNAILEAMAAGLPIIATNVGGNPEIINEKFGFFFNFGDYVTLSNHLVSLLIQAEGREIRGNLAKVEATKKYSIAAMLNSYYSIIETIL